MNKNNKEKNSTCELLGKDCTDKLIRMFILIMYMFRCNVHDPATDSHRRVEAAQTLAKRS